MENVYGNVDKEGGAGVDKCKGTKAPEEPPSKIPETELASPSIPGGDAPDSGGAGGIVQESEGRKGGVGSDTAPVKVEAALSAPDEAKHASSALDLVDPIFMSCAVASLEP